MGDNGMRDGRFVRWGLNTIFGFVEQDYELPEGVFEQIGVDIFE